MAQERDQIDLRTLEEVRRLLASSDFASAGDLLGRTGGPVSFEPMALPRWPERLETASVSADPLPRRR